MSQALLFVALHLVGLAITGTVGPRGSVALVCALAFPTGLAAAVSLAILLLAIGIPYNAATLAAAALLVAALLVAARRPAVDRAAVATALAWTAGFGLVGAVLGHFNLSLMNWDSHRIVLLGGIVGRQGEFEPRMLSELQAFGVFQIVAHSMAEFTRRDYLYALQPVFGLSFLPVFALTLWRATGLLGAGGRLRAAAVGLVTAALFSLYIFAHHLFFIHTNLGTALYLFGFVALFWLAEEERDPAGLPVAFLFLLALALQRIETPILALVALVAATTATELPRRAVTPLVALFTALIAGWYILLAFHVSPNSLFLTPSRCVALAGAVIAHLGWWLLAGRPRFQAVTRRAHLLAAGAFALALAGAFATRTDHMIDSVRAWSTTLTTLPHWGYACYGIVAAALISCFGPPPPRHRAFTLTIWLSLAYTLLLVYARIPYRVSLLDSANRMTIHVLPLLFFYLGLKAIPAAARPARRLSSP